MNIAIVGGGVSGLYCALRLLEEEIGRTITIYEKSSRVGGKIRSEHRSKGTLEHGAWRIADDHVLVKALVSDFDTFKYPESTHEVQESERKSYMSQFASWLFGSGPYQAAQSDLDTGYADSSSCADDGERHSGQYIGLTNGYEQIIDHLVEQIGKTQTLSKQE